MTWTEEDKILARQRNILGDTVIYRGVRTYVVKEATKKKDLCKDCAYSMAKKCPHFAMAGKKYDCKALRIEFRKVD